MPNFKTTENDTGKLVDKTYKVPGTFQISKILEYLYQNLDVKSHIIDTRREQQSAQDHLAVALRVPKERYP